MFPCLYVMKAHAVPVILFQIKEVWMRVLRNPPALLINWQKWSILSNMKHSFSLTTLQHLQLQFRLEINCSGQELSLFRVCICSSQHNGWSLAWLRSLGATLIHVITINPMEGSDLSMRIHREVHFNPPSFICHSISKGLPSKNRQRGDSSWLQLCFRVPFLTVRKFPSTALKNSQLLLTDLASAVDSVSGLEIINIRPSVAEFHSVFC